MPIEILEMIVRAKIQDNQPPPATPPENNGKNGAPATEELCSIQIETIVANILKRHKER